MEVGGGDADRQRQALAVDDEVDFRSLSCRGRSDPVPSAAPFEGPDADGVNRAPRPVQLTPGTELVQDQAVQLDPHPGLGPLGEPAEGCHARQPEAWWQLFQVQPEVATKMMAASTSRSPRRRCPPP